MSLETIFFHGIQKETFWIFFMQLFSMERPVPQFQNNAVIFLLELLKIVFVNWNEDEIIIKKYDIKRLPLHLQV